LSKEFQEVKAYYVILWSFKWLSEECQYIYINYHKLFEIGNSYWLSQNTNRRSSKFVLLFWSPWNIQNIFKY
jgi:hypothetical protein